MDCITHYWEDSWLKYYPRVNLLPANALIRLLSYCPRERDTNFVFGKESEVPRCVLHFGKEYRYGGKTRRGMDFSQLPDELLTLKLWSETHANTTFNNIIVNYYIRPNDYVAIHSDRNTVSGSPIYSFSFGSTRMFHVYKKPVLQEKILKLHLPLEDKSLLIMGGKFQDEYMHCILKGKTWNPRINVTLRNLE